ncbi:telomerase inhibitor [Pleosporales sp. CAS-2024a]
MGLAGPKNRSRISNDPQNTTWANNTSRFGHRILASQGWQPGDSLGASDAAHAAHYTAASQSHIRVFLKEDNLGLGAKRGSERAENFGLAGLESILGRLNGKEAEVKKEEERREEIEKRAFVYRKYGMMNFVSGGFLVGDKIKSRDEVKKEKEAEVKVEIKSELESDGPRETDKKTKRKRKACEDDGANAAGDEDRPNLKRKKKSMDLRHQANKDNSDECSKKKSNKDKTGKKSKKDAKAVTSDAEPMSSGLASPGSDPEPVTDKARRKAEKRARKEEKKLKKALKKAAKEARKTSAEVEDESSESEHESTPSTWTPTVSAAGLTFNPRGMHAVRQKWIRSKKRATMDAQAMREIFMIKTPS